MDDVAHVHSLLAGAAVSDFACRTVVSRAYNCAYPRVTAYAVSCGFIPTGRGSDHSAVVAFLSATGRPRPSVTVGTRLRALHRLRKWADYERGLTLSLGTAAEAVDMMDEIVAAIAAGETA